VKAHRGEPANEEADIQGKDVSTEWHDRTNRAVFTWQESCRKEGTVSYEDRKLTWNSGVRKAIRRGSVEEKVRKHRDRVTGAWKYVRKQSQRVNVNYNPSMVTALWHGAWIEERRVQKRLVSRRRKKGEARTSLYTVHG